MLRAIVRTARRRNLPIHTISKPIIADSLGGARRNKYSVATVIAERFPELAPSLPRQRKLWEGEDYRMSVFDAAAAGSAYFKMLER
jgi:hypothetical protein